MNDKNSTPGFAETLVHRKRGVAGVSPEIIRHAIWDSFRKLSPRTLVRSPVMFVVEIVAAATTVVLARDIIAGNPGISFTGQIAFW
ncbi:MAG: hypothetical protein WAN51_09480, partial [Alphaproteobacteria bacterium]